jgi:hypothetical protein
VSNSVRNERRHVRLEIRVSGRVARWFILRPKIPIPVYFGMEYVGIFMAIWYVLQPFGKFHGPLVYVLCGHLVYSVATWNSLWSFGTS